MADDPRDLELPLPGRPAEPFCRWEHITTGADVLGLLAAASTALDVMELAAGYWAHAQAERRLLAGEIAASGQG